MTFRMTTVLPAPDLARATAGLRIALALAVADAGAGAPDWDTLTVEGPEPRVDGRGLRHAYTGTVEARAERPVPARCVRA